MAILVGSALSGPPARTAYIVTLTQQGSSVVATGGGSIDLASLIFGGPSVTPVGINPSSGFIATGPAAVFESIDVYARFTGPTSFGSGGLTLANSGSGDTVGIASPVLFVPPGYVSGSALSDSSTYDNQTFSSLGVTPGSYVWNWGSGPTADSFTLDIATAAVPEPSSVLLLAAPLGLVILLMARRRRAPRSARMCRDIVLSLTS